MAGNGKPSGMPCTSVAYVCSLKVLSPGIIANGMEMVGQVSKSVRSYELPASAVRFMSTSFGNVFASGSTALKILLKCMSGFFSFSLDLMYSRIFVTWGKRTASKSILSGEAWQQERRKSSLFTQVISTRGLEDAGDVALFA